MSENKNISQDVVAHMARLSRLAVSDEEKALFARQFGDILAYMDVLGNAPEHDEDYFIVPRIV